jgi:hypothetical protein
MTVYLGAILLAESSFSGLLYPKSLLRYENQKDRKKRD